MKRTWAGPRIWVALALLGPWAAGCDRTTKNGGGADSPTPSSSNSPRRGTSGDRPRLLFIANSESDWWTAVERGMEDGNAEFGAQAELRRNTQGSTLGQIRLLEEALSLRDVKGVAVSVIEAKAAGIAEALRKLKGKGKIIITIDSDVAPDRADLRRAYIGTNNVRAGQAAGNAAKVIRPGGGKVVTFVGTAASANARERKQGFFQGAGPAFEDVEVFEDRSNKLKARSNVQNALSKHRDVGVLVGLWSYNAPAIAEELASFPNRRKTITVVTFDLDQKAVEDIEMGRIDVSVCQNPYEMGYRGVQLLKAYIDEDVDRISEMLPGGTRFLDTGIRVIVPDSGSPIEGDNVLPIGEMKKWLAINKLKSS